MTSPKILVTTATGKTGSEIIRQLSAAGIAARALTRNPAKAQALALPQIEIVGGDLNDRASIDAAMAGIEAVYLNVVPGPDALAQVDTVLAAARAAGVRRVVKLSGLHAQPDSPSAIIRMHAAGDQQVRDSGLAWTNLRANSFFQNVEQQLAGIKETGQFYLPLGEARQSLIDVVDIAAVAVIALSTSELEGRDCDLTGAQSLTYAEVAGELARASGRSVAYVAISNDQFAASLREAGLPEPVVANVAELFAQFANGTYAEPTGDVAAILGRAPTSYAAYAERLFAQ